MPPLPNFLDLIRRNLEEIEAGNRPATAEIGDLYDHHLEEINTFRLEEGFKPINGRLIFIGRHVHKSRIVQNGYSIDDVLDQIENALQPCSILQLTETGTALQNPNKREDKYGNSVRDKIVLECHKHHPLSQLWSVIPSGDTNKPK